MSQTDRLTEQSSPFRHLEQMATGDLLRLINQMDQQVPAAVSDALPQIERLAEAMLRTLQAGGRVFYLGAGTSGRLGIVDASEWPPTFGVDPNPAIALIAGGDAAIRKAREFAEDNAEQGWADLQAHRVGVTDIVIGLSASGRTPYVVGALQRCREHQISTGCITCNPGTPLAAASDYPVEVMTGPEFLTGSTRMKCGTAQKLVLNMLSTTVMIRMGHVLDNKMVDMQLANEKLIDRGTRLLMQLMAWDYRRARHILEEYGSVRKVLEAHRKIPSRPR
ncbi:MAG: N-acetylmuramic acid 6-phosphate etherase [Chitinophagales bacterium]|nr:N-acetylmuramic acid 6-phosphate etherase [Chitinophagales bacterium]MDW8393498.1 N-acetylmuramic acid 6-phosphate etherase [Chitinophagales bacterium]